MFVFPYALMSVEWTDEDGDNEISTVEAEEKWSKRTREGHSPVTFARKYQQAPKKQLKINTM